jgi:CBS domain-containing protein
MGAKVSEVLRNKGFEVATVRPDETVADVVAMLTRNRIGAAPVLDERGRLAGIISERDVMRGIAAHGDHVLALSARELMTREVQTCAPNDEIVELMEIMTNQRIRHLPVIQDGTLIGIVSIGDVVKQRLAEAHFELEELHRYIGRISCKTLL